MLLLASEESVSRKAARRVGQLDARSRLAVAGRIAYILVFANRSAVWTNADRGDVPPVAIAVDDLAGGVETAGGVRVQVTTNALREVLDTGLFSPGGVTTVGFSHRTYLERFGCIPSGQKNDGWLRLLNDLV